MSSNTFLKSVSLSLSPLSLSLSLTHSLTHSPFPVVFARSLPFASSSLYSGKALLGYLPLWLWRWWLLLWNLLHGPHVVEICSLEQKIAFPYNNSTLYQVAGHLTCVILVTWLLASQLQSKVVYKYWHIFFSWCYLPSCHVMPSITKYFRLISSLAILLDTIGIQNLRPFILKI